MTDRVLPALALTVALALLAACSSGPGPDAAGPDVAHAEEKEGGIIGTGIVGTVTGLGSIHVNGLRVTMPETLMMSSAMGEEPAYSLVPGDTVVIEIADDAVALQANRVTRYLPLIAPITQVDPARGAFTALGATVQVSPGAQILSLDGQGLDLAGLDVGDWVAVNGVWRGRELIASRIKRVEPHDTAHASGLVTLAPGGGWRIGGVRLSSPAPEIQAAEGRAASVQGGILVRDEPVLEPETVSIGLFSGPVRRLSIEGYLTPPLPDGRYRVHGAGQIMDLPVAAGPMVLGRGIFCAIRNGDLTIKEQTALPEATEMRVAKLEAMALEPVPARDSCGM
jgi:hypothetical protein